MALKKTIAVMVTILSGIIFSCEEHWDIGIMAENTKLIAVEGIVTNENKSHVIRLTLPYQRLNGTSAPLNGASVSISDGSVSIWLTAGDSGKYLTPNMRFVAGKRYTLTIQHNGRQITAHDSSVPVESLTALSYSKVEGGYRINFLDTGSQPNYIDYSVDWSSTPSCPELSCKARMVHYDLKTVDTNELFKPEKTDFVFPIQSTIIRRKFSVSDQYRAYLRSMLSETQWRGSVFDVQRDNAPTNLSEGAIGFFAVSTVVSDTLKIQ